MDEDEISKHGKVVADSPAGWEGGELAHTGGNLFAREWINPQKGLRVGYSIEDPSVVGVEKVRYEGRGGRRQTHRCGSVSATLKANPVTTKKTV